MGRPKDLIFFLLWNLVICDNFRDEKIQGEEPPCDILLHISSMHISKVNGMMDICLSITQIYQLLRAEQVLPGSEGVGERGRGWGRG
jgi:hypothetical protein